MAKALSTDVPRPATSRVRWLPFGLRSNARDLTLPRAYSGSTIDSRHRVSPGCAPDKVASIRCIPTRTDALVFFTIEKCDVFRSRFLAGSSTYHLRCRKRGIAPVNWIFKVPVWSRACCIGLMIRRAVIVFLKGVFLMVSRRSLSSRIYALFTVVNSSNKTTICAPIFLPSVWTLGGIKCNNRIGWNCNDESSTNFLGKPQNSCSRNRRNDSH